jgi:hypothetical protein
MGAESTSQTSEWRRIGGAFGARGAKVSNGKPNDEKRKPNKS